MLIQGFHWTRPSDLRPGDIIPYGRWGNGVYSSPITHKNGVKELLYEYVRRESYPNAVSRLNCIFLCGNLESAYAFGRYRRSDTLYEVESVIESPRFTNAHYDMMPGSNASYDDIIELANRYWSTIDFPPRMHEILLESDVRVIRRVDLPQNYWTRQW